MTVSTILSVKGRDIITIEPGATLTAAAKLLAEKRIGALLILGPDHRITGNSFGTRHRASNRRARSSRVGQFC
jgi:CBS domain-containing protein